MDNMIQENEKIQENIQEKNIGQDLCSQNLHQVNPYGQMQQFNNGAGAPPMMPYIAEESSEKKHERALRFKAMLLPTLIYAFFFTLFLYENYSSYTMPLFVMATLCYCNYCMNKMEVAQKKGTVFYFAGMLLLGVSSFLTGNGFIIFCNTVGIGLLLICMLLHNFYDDAKWGFGKYVESILCAIFGAISCIGDPFTDASCYQKEAKDEKHSTIMYVGIGVAISLPLLVIVILLLSSADLVFAEFINNINWNFGDIIGVSITFIFALLASYCGIRYLGKGSLSAESKAPKMYEPVIATTVLSLLSIVYVFFCMIQIVYLFIGNMKLPQDYTYAEYAREGFFQLLFVCLLNLIIVLIVLGHFEKRPILKGLLALISACTYIMVASSAYRMTLYVQNYQLSFLRVLVFWGLGVIALFLAGIMIQIFKTDFPLFRYGLVMFSVCYLLLAFGRPDYLIANYNLSAFDKGQGEKAEFLDYWYVADLSTDAAPAIADFVKTHTLSSKDKHWVEHYVARVSDFESESIRQLNLSHAVAKSLFKDEIEALHIKEQSEVYEQ